MFQGFSEESIEFLWGIHLNNERSWFMAHKQQYLDQVQTPLRELGEAVYDAFSRAHSELSLILKVSRIYRDARRLYGRGPYKSHLWFSLRMAGEDWARLPVFWFGIHPQGYGYGLGIYDPRPADMARYRRFVDEHPEGLRKLAVDFEKQNRFQLEGEEYKRPKGNPGAPLDRWYNRKQIDLTCNRPVEPRLFEPALTEDVLTGFEALLPYYRYFNELFLRAD